MENIYNLNRQFEELSEKYDSLSAEINAIYEENGGEVTEETEHLEEKLSALSAMKDEVVGQILSCPDDFAAIVKNAEAQKKMLEAELKVLKEEQAKVVAKLQARINSKANKIEWFKANIREAMKLADIDRIGGGKTGSKFSIYFTTTKSIETDDVKLVEPYIPALTELYSKLPSWLTVETKVNKNTLKSQDVLPDGASLVENKNLQIR